MVSHRVPLTRRVCVWWWCLCVRVRTLSVFVSPSVIPNCTAKIRKSLHTLVADDTETKVKNFSQLLYTRPIDRGYVVDWECEKTVLDHLFGRKYMGIGNPAASGMLMTVAPFTPEVLLEDTEEVMFEEYGFGSFRTTSAALLAAVHQREKSAGATSCGIVIDSGFSFTHAVPIFDDHVVRTPTVGGCVQGGGEVGVGVG